MLQRHIIRSDHAHPPAFAEKAVPAFERIEAVLIIGHLLFRVFDLIPKDLFVLIQIVG